MCFNSANKNYRNKRLQYSPKIKKRITTLTLEYDWPETRYMGKNEKSLRGVLGRDI